MEHICFVSRIIIIPVNKNQRIYDYCRNKFISLKIHRRNGIETRLG
jgi:hypothetical protein